jgi:flagellar protein FlbD
VGPSNREISVPFSAECGTWIKDWKTAVIYVTRLDGSNLVVNADLIETVEHTADTVITLLDGKKLVVKTPVEDVVSSVIAYRQAIARGPMRQPDSPPLHSVSAAINTEPTPFRPREAH